MPRLSYCLRLLVACCTCWGPCDVLRPAMWLLQGRRQASRVPRARRRQAACQPCACRWPMCCPGSCRPTTTTSAAFWASGLVLLLLLVLLPPQQVGWLQWHSCVAARHAACVVCSSKTSQPYRGWLTKICHVVSRDCHEQNGAMADIRLLCVHLLVSACLMQWYCKLQAAYHRMTAHHLHCIIAQAHLILHVITGKNVSQSLATLNPCIACTPLHRWAQHLSTCNCHMQAVAAICHPASVRPALSKDMWQGPTSWTASSRIQRRREPSWPASPLTQVPLYCHEAST